MVNEELQLSQNLARQTSYALLTAVEADLRALIYGLVTQDNKIAEILGHDLYAKAVSRSEKDGYADRSKVVDFLDFGDTIAVLNRNKPSIATAVANLLRQSTERLEKLIPIRNRVMHSRPMEFEDHPFVIETCRQLLSNRQVPFDNLTYWYNSIKADPSSVLNLKISGAYSADENQFLENLPVPDFDDTGFLGRRSQVQELKRLLFSNWPVVTIVGEGGIGKTALAVKLAYDVLDDKENPFDAIIWSSSKTTSLTENDIIEIDGAIKDSIGLFRYIDDQLDASQGDPAENVLDYMNTFNILLILDNLETILDNEVRNFISGISSGSKVLITSRIGLGELERRYQLGPLDNKESIKLLRATAQSRGMNSLANAKGNELSRYCRRMYGNPAFIKWFVSAVQSGRRPESIVARPDKFLDFCMANVIEHLDEEARDLMEVFLIYPGSHSPSVLAYLANLSSEKLQPPLQKLLTTNVLKLSIKTVDGIALTSYEIADLPRAYLVKTFRPSPERAQAVIQRKGELIDAQERFSSDESNKYVLQTISLRSRDDAVAAKHLTSALKHTARGELEFAQREVEQARGMAPDYFEVYRVEGFVSGQAGNYPQAQQSYSTAVELAGRSAPVRYWYGGFLLRYMNDAEAAEKQFRVAHDLDPVSSEILNELSRSLTYRHQYSEAEDYSLMILSREKNTTKTLRIAYDGLAQIYARRTQFELSNKNYSASLESVKQLARLTDKIPTEIVDQKILTSIEKVLSAQQRLETVYRNTNNENDVEMVFSYIRQFLYNRDHSSATTMARFRQTEADSGAVLHSSNDGRATGTISRMITDRYFGFIDGADGHEYFFHRENLEGPKTFRELRVGDKVKFLATSNDKGAVADNVVVLSATAEGETSKPEKVPVIGEIRQGAITDLIEERGYCFIQDNNGHRYFAHASNFEDPKMMKVFSEKNTPLEFTVEIETDGRFRATRIVPVETLEELPEVIPHTKLIGTVKTKETTFGFAWNEEFGDIFFHQSDFIESTEWDICFVGSDIEYEIERDDQRNRTKAINVKLTSRM